MVRSESIAGGSRRNAYRLPDLWHPHRHACNLARVLGRRRRRQRCSARRSNRSELRWLNVQGSVRLGALLRRAEPSDRRRTRDTMCRCARNESGLARRRTQWTIVTAVLGMQRRH
jgi:hypothetical protein